MNMKLKSSDKVSSIVFLHVYCHITYSKDYTHTLKKPGYL